MKGIWLTLAFDKDGRTLKEGRATEEVVEDNYYRVDIGLTEAYQTFRYSFTPVDLNIPVGEKYFKSGLEEFEQFQRDFDNRHINVAVPRGIIYRKIPAGSAKWEAEEKAFWKDWNARYDLFAVNNRFVLPPKEKQLYLAFGGKEDTGSRVKGCLKGAAGWKDITGNIYTYYADATAKLQVFQLYDVVSNYLYRIVVDETVMNKPTPGISLENPELFATIVEIYERKNKDESGMKFPVVGRDDFIFPAKENPVFSNKKALQEYLSHFLSTGLGSIPSHSNNYYQYVGFERP